MEFSFFPRSFLQLSIFIFLSFRVSSVLQFLISFPSQLVLESIIPFPVTTMIKIVSQIKLRVNVLLMETPPTRGSLPPLKVRESTTSETSSSIIPVPLIETPLILKVFSPTSSTPKVFSLVRVLGFASTEIS